MELPEMVMEIAKAFQAEGEELFLVGGAVRDSILGITPKDYDLATGAPPETVIAIAKQLPVHKILEQGREFGVIKLVMSNREEYEIATFRRDIGSGRRPESVVYASIEEDVKRRDFTINALVYNPLTTELLDYVGGLEHIKAGIVTTVGNPEERFAEDRLRALRALRFAARFGKLSNECAKAIWNNNSLEGVSRERMVEEFVKGCLGTNGVEYVHSLHYYGFSEFLFPRLQVNTAGLYNTSSIAVTLATLLRENLETSLEVPLRVFGPYVNEVLFLIRFKELNFSNAYQLKKALQKTFLTEEQLMLFGKQTGMSMATLVAFVNYQLSVKAEVLAAQGFKGAELGKEILRQETEKFATIYGK